MSTAAPIPRGYPGPRWSVATPAGTSALEPLPISGLPIVGRYVSVGPPLSANGSSMRSLRNGRLLPLAPVRVKPVPLPMALKLAVTLTKLQPMSSSSATPTLPETMEFASVTVPAMPPTAIPPAGTLEKLTAW
jgi:hypothetical protein